MLVPGITTNRRLLTSALMSRGTRAPNGIEGGILAPRGPAAARCPGGVGGAAGLGIVALACNTWHPAVTPAISKRPFGSAVALGVITVAAHSHGATESGRRRAGCPVVPLMTDPRTWKDGTVPERNEISIPLVLKPG